MTRKGEDTMTRVLSLQRLAKPAVIVALAAISVAPAYAGTAAPWEGAMQMIVDWLTGTTARLFIIVAAAIALYGMAFAERGSVFHKIGYVGMAAALLGVIVNVVDLLMGGSGAILR